MNFFQVTVFTSVTIFILLSDFLNSQYGIIFNIVYFNNNNKLILHKFLVWL